MGSAGDGSHRRDSRAGLRLGHASNQASEVKVITKEQARGDSPEVTPTEYARACDRGKWIVAHYLRVAREVPTDVLDAIVASLTDEWGGVTLDARTWQAVAPSEGYAVAIAGNFAGSSLSCPIGSSEVTIHQFVRELVNAYPDVPYYGVFRDDDTGRIDFDPVLVVTDEGEARDVATFCGSLGGAYDFATGNGVFPYHVAETVSAG